MGTGSAFRWRITVRRPVREITVGPGKMPSYPQISVRTPGMISCLAARWVIS